MRYLAAAALIASLLGTAARGNEPILQSLRDLPTISVGVGERKRMTFDEPVTRIEISTKDVAEITPQSDRQFTVTGLSAGDTRFFAFGPDGHRVHVGSITVTTQPGHVVKIYRTTPASRTSDTSSADDPGREDDYSILVCTEVSCSKPDRARR